MTRSHPATSSFIIMILTITVTGCGGLTYEPYSESWTLRAGSHPKQSPSGELSKLLQCLIEEGKVQSNLCTWLCCILRFYLILYAFSSIKYTILLL